MRYTLFIYFVFVSLNSIAQKCDRPDKVFIRLNSVDSDMVLNCIRNQENRIYLQDSSEIFIRSSELIEISETRYSEIGFYSIEELREKELQIRTCEVKKADNSIYLDINSNSVFKEIYMVVNNKEKIYQFLVSWEDGVE